MTVGCEGTHSVFPRCNLTCSPCYHSADANKVRTDGAHTLGQIESQMAYAQSERGPRAHAQLIGGEVSLLDADDHAAALLAMRRRGREPMSFSHGDFSDEYLERIAVTPDGDRRLRRLSFAIHIDSLMRGRSSHPRPRSEAELHPVRLKVVKRFRDLHRRHGVRWFLAHNMTVTPSNVDEVADVAGVVAQAGYGLISFQPAAHVGDDRRWDPHMRDLDPDDVWRRIEEGLGSPLPSTDIQVGHPSCNRSAFGWMVGSAWIPAVAPGDSRDLKARDACFSTLGGVQFGDTALPLLLIRLLRLTLTHPSSVPITLGWLRRALRRSGGVMHVLRHRPRPLTVVMHMFMDAELADRAWQVIDEVDTDAEPEVAEAVDRLRSCAYSMAHPELGRMVPACVQHAVLDPPVNAELRRTLPLIPLATSQA
jgi:MoaA/NifB/PqqE/SkfB family radical SAM enzyme